MNRFPVVRNRLLAVHLLLTAFLLGLAGVGAWRLLAFSPDPLGAAGVVAVAAALVFLPATLFRIAFLLTASYDLAASGSLTVRFGSWREVLPIEDVEEIRSGGKIPDAVRKRAPGWLDMWRGRIAAGADGDIDWMATESEGRLLLLVTKQRYLAISPADPAGFASCLTGFSARGSLEKTERISVRPPSDVLEIIKNPPALGLLAGGLIGAASLGAFLVGIQAGLPADQPFRFDPAGLPTSLGNPIRLLILPMAGGFVWMLNAVIGWWAWRKGQMPSAYALWAVSLLVMVGLWTASAFLISAK
jgi:hypothetical protein